MEIYLPVPQILQNPELPNGCEITSLSEVLNYLGFAADKCDLADHYLPQSRYWYGADPDVEYMGNPRLDDSSPETGYYCFAGPIITAATRWLQSNAPECGIIPTDLTGATEQVLIEQLQAGRPVIFWASLHFKDIQFDSCGSYSLPDGRIHRVFHQLHCMVLCGISGDYFRVADPLNYNQEIERGQFMKIFRQLGSRAVVLIKNQ